MFIPLVNGAQCTDDLVHDRRSQLHYMLSPSARSNIGEIDALSVSFCERQRELHTRHFEFTHSLRHNACCTWRLYKAWALIRQHFLSVKTANFSVKYFLSVPRNFQAGIPAGSSHRCCKKGLTMRDRRPPLILKLGGQLILLGGNTQMLLAKRIIRMKPLKMVQ